MTRETPDPQEPGQTPDPDEPGPAPVELPEKRPKKTKKKPGQGSGVVKTRRQRDKPLLHVLVWPEGGGEPYPLDVELGSDGWFYLDKKQKGPRYRVRPGTVVYEDGKFRATVREGVFETIDVRALELGPPPDELDGLLVGDILRDLGRASRRRMGAWQTAGAATFGLLALGFLGVAIWAVINLGDIHNVLEGILQALEGIKVQSSPPPGSTAGHQPISPGG